MDIHGGVFFAKVTVNVSDDCMIGGAIYMTHTLLYMLYVFSFLFTACYGFTSESPMPPLHALTQVCTFSTLCIVNYTHSLFIAASFQPQLHKLQYSHILHILSSVNHFSFFSSLLLLLLFCLFISFHAVSTGS